MIINKFNNIFNLITVINLLVIEKVQITTKVKYHTEFIDIQQMTSSFESNNHNNNLKIF